MTDLATRTSLLRRAADRVAHGITTGHDWPNTDDELARLQAGRLLRECADEIERVRSGVDVLILMRMDAVSLRQGLQALMRNGVL